MVGRALAFGSLLPDVRGRPPGRLSQELSSRLAAVESRDITYMDGGWPVFWEEARGSNVRDADGNVYVDLTSAFGVSLVGHAHPEVVRSIEGQLRRLIHGMGDVHPPRIKVDLLERLSEVGPWPDTRVALSSTGSEAVETGLKTALMASGKPGLIAFEGAYHGLTLGSLATTGREHFRGPFGDRLYGGVSFVPFPDPLEDGSDAMEASLAAVAEAIEAGAPNGDPIGAIVIEPVQGRAGARVAPDGFMRRLSKLAREAGVLIVADEVFTGLGRCGAMFASERVGLRPDVVCLGKALGGGMQISACLAPSRVMDAWPASGGEAIHTSTFLGHPLSCAAALAVLDTLSEEAIPERAGVLGSQLLEALRSGLSGAPGVADVRGLGLMIGIDFREPDGTPSRGRAVRIAKAALREGWLLLPAGAEGHVLELTPTADLTDVQVDAVVEAVVRLSRETT